jgi:hypothetical protein
MNEAVIRWCEHGESVRGLESIFQAIKEWL